MNNRRFVGENKMFNKEIYITADNEMMLYKEMVLKNINFALISIDFILNSSCIDYNRYIDGHTFYFYYIQNLLAACGNISNVLNSRIYYNNKANIMSPAERSRELCKAFDLNLKEYPLVFQREARNTNMHFDERYDEYNRYIGDYNIIDENTLDNVRTAILNTPHLRTYDKQNQTYITFDKKGKKIVISLNQLYQELIALKNKLKSVDILHNQQKK